MNEAEKSFEEWVKDRDNPWEDKEKGFYFKNEMIDFAIKFAKTAFLHAREGEYGCKGNPPRVKVNFKFEHFEEYLDAESNNK
jgi:hypothetical protein